MQRLLAAVGASTIAEAARALSVDGETVRVWSKAGRIPDSKLRLIALQTGCRISWLRDGEGPQYDRNPGLVVSEPVSTYDALSPRERALLDNYRALDEAAKSTLEQTGALFAQQAAAGSRRRSGQR
ncbi:MAG: helix-turn-helix domain containing protein [Burkholderiaceae bacterium]|nr:helix-turn-helix domain containing protein [Burkholderiaceae bacterium]